MAIYIKEGEGGVGCSFTRDGKCFVAGDLAKAAEGSNYKDPKAYEGIISQACLNCWEVRELREKLKRGL